MAKYLSVDEAARYLKISILDLLDLEKNRDIKAFAGNDGGWYFTQDNLDEYLERNNTSPSNYYVYEEYTEVSNINIPPNPPIKVKHAFPKKHGHIKISLDIENPGENITEIDIKTNENTNSSKLDRLTRMFTIVLLFFITFDFIMFLFYLFLTAK